MIVLMVSANPLFIEAVRASLTNDLGTELRSAEPAAALQIIRECSPEVILIDEAIPAVLLRNMLKELHDSCRTRLVLLSCTGNEFTILDSYRSEIGNAEDLA